MIRLYSDSEPSDVCYAGTRMTAAEFMCLPESACKYELIDGVVFMSPTASPLHQRVVTELTIEIGTFLRQNPIGQVCVEVDVNLGAGSDRQLVYRPDLVYLRQELAEKSRRRINGAPDLVVEVISPDSRRYDSTTKKDDYERCGVGEYWLIDPFETAMTFYTRRQDQFVEIDPEEDRVASRVISGFVLELGRVRQIFTQGQ